MSAPTPPRELEILGVSVRRAWTNAEIRDALHELVHARKAELPGSRDAALLLKPNLNNDLPALTGNSTDLRVLQGLITALQDLGYTRIAVADGPNVGVERRGIDVFGRLRIRALCEQLDVRLIDLNREDGPPVQLTGSARPRVAQAILDADFVVSVPTVKTHAEAGMSIACKNWVGICVAQDKRQMHQALGANIAALVRQVPPHWVVTDGIVGMEGNGPGDGDPVRLGFVALADDPWRNDLVICRLVGFDWRRVPYLVEASPWSEDELAAVAALTPWFRIHPAPPRNILAELSDHPRLFWLKKAARPITGSKRVASLAYRAGIIQDVYDLEDDTLEIAARDPERCEDCTRCEAFCPVHIPLAEIGRSDRCIDCLYCWWTCPKDALSLQGEDNALRRPAARYKDALENL